jgi:glycosyltransferase involved in cell wall biosynthesis
VPTTPVRVCNVITHLEVGGATEAAINACAHVDAERFRTVLVCGPSPAGERDARPLADELGVDVIVLPSLARPIRPGRDLATLRALRRTFRSWHPDIVHTHSSKAGFLGRRAARREGVAVVHTVHGWSFHDHMAAATRALYVGLERRAARWTDRIVTVSDLDRDKGLAAGIGAPEQYTVIHELNDVGRFLAADRNRAEARRRLGLGGAQPVIGTLGRLSEQKDPATFVRAAAAVSVEVPDARFVMIGDGPLRTDVERLAAKLGLQDRFLVTGVRRDVAEVLAGLDVFILTSRWEGMPLVIPQAMASDVPVVASTADGNRELVRDGENGLLASPGAADAFAAGAVRLLRDASLRERFVTAGRQTARRFTLDETVPRLERVYGECASEKFIASAATEAEDVTKRSPQDP